MGASGSLADHIRDVADFPRPGIVFRDITPLLAEPAAFRATVDTLADHVGDLQVDKVVAIEARGFIVAAPLAYRVGAGLVPVRKSGKLPRAVGVRSTPSSTAPTASRSMPTPSAGVSPC